MPRAISCGMTSGIDMASGLLRQSEATAAVKAAGADRGAVRGRDGGAGREPPWGHALPFQGLEGDEPLTGRAFKVLVVLCLHAALAAAILHVQVGPPEVFEPIRVAVRMVELAAPEPPAAAPEPVTEPPRPLPQVVKPPEPVKPPVITAREVAPELPVVAAPPPPPVAEVRSEAPSAAAPAVTAVRFDADYLNNPAPAYPPMSRRRGEQGKVLLLVQVDAQGAAGRVEIQESSGHTRLDNAALEAVRRWRFVPARRGDQAVAASVVVPILFRLDG